MNRPPRKESTRPHMLKTFWLPFLIVFMSSVVFALPKDPRGFYPLGDRRVPEAVSKASASVFRIYSVSADLIETIDLEKEQNPETRFQKRFAKLAKEKRVVDPKQLEIHLEEIKQCRIHLLKACEIHELISQGSAFLMGDG